jgi:hypothetical protein
VVELDTPDADGVTVFEGHGTCTTEVNANNCGGSGATPNTKPGKPLPMPAPQPVASGRECTYSAFVAHIQVRRLVNAPPAVPVVFPPIADRAAAARR